MNYFNEMKALYPRCMLALFINSIMITFLLIIVDANNLFSIVVEQYGSFFLVTCLFLIVTYFLFNYYEHIESMWILKSVNMLDYSLFLCIVTSAINLLLVLLNGSNCYKYIMLVIVIVISLFMLIKRCNYINSIELNKQVLKYNLNDFIEDKNIIEDQEFILDDNPSDIDLLGREIIIERLKNIIVDNNSDESFVVSLEGEWGSGKTTILHMLEKDVKKSDVNNSIEFIYFDPWLYKDQKAMLKEMLNKILVVSKFKYSSIKLDLKMDTVIEIIFGYVRKSFNINVGDFFYSESNEFVIQALKDNINSYLERENKKIVFVIDNVDRIEAPNVLLIFSIVGNMFKINRINYVLSYDKKRISEIYKEQKKNGFDERYLEKIVNCSIHVLPISNEKKRYIIIKTLSKIFKIRNIHIVNFQGYEEIINFLVENIDDLRTFKRFINTVILGSGFNAYCKENLNIKTVLILEIVKFFNLSLYEVIRREKEYFISIDYLDNNYYFILDSQKSMFNQKMNEKYNEIFSQKENIIFLKILAEIFDYANKFYNDKKHGLTENGNMVNFLDNNIYRGNNKSRTINDNKFFDSYFSYQENRNIKIFNIVDEFINDINNGNDYTSETFEAFWMSFMEEEQFDVFQYLEEKFEKKEIVNIYLLGKVFLKNIFIFNSKYEYESMFSSIYRAKIFIFHILESISDEEYICLRSIMFGNYKYIALCSDINVYYNNPQYTVKHEDRREDIRKNVINLREKILKEKVNLYNDEYYTPKITQRIIDWSISDSNKVIIDQEIIPALKKYFANILNQQNVYQFLYDLMQESYSSNGIYGYKLVGDVILSLELQEKINELMYKKENIDANEKFLQDLYEQWLREGNNASIEIRNRFNLDCF